MKRFALSSGVSVGFWLVAAFLTGCNPETHGQSVVQPTRLRVGLPPSRSEAEVLKANAPLFNYLSKELKVTFELEVAHSSKELLQQFHRKNIDLGFFGGYVFTRSRVQDQGKPLVMRNVDRHFNTYLIVRKDSKFSRLEDLEGGSLCFGDLFSTSGHIMPRYFLGMSGIEPEKFFRDISHSDSHEATWQKVVDGMCDGGMINALLVDDFINEKRAGYDQLRVIWQSPPYPNHVWVMQPHLGQEFYHRLRDAFFALTLADQDHHPILNALDAEAFYPAKSGDFNQVELAVSFLENGYE